MNTEEIKARLIALREAAQRACSAAYVARHEIGGSVNWGDLGAGQARYWMEEDGTTGYEVTIEEASPEAAKFHDFIRREMAAAGFADVEIRLEW